MIPFKFIQSQDADSAVATAAGGSRFIAGGTNLLDLMKFGVEAPERLIDINRLNLREIELRADGSIQIGALVSNSDLAYHPGIQKRYPVLSEALLSGASPQLRNMATVGGNLMQRTRCPYFYDLNFACNKRNPGAGCDALEGYNRSHAILGTSTDCIATHPSDMCVALAALDANVHVQGTGGERTIAMGQFHRLPGNTPEKESALETGELITHVSIPELPFGWRSHYLKVRDRASYEFALSSAAVALAVRDGNIENARVALGGVGTVPWRVREAEAILIGSAASPETFQRAAEAALAGAKPQKYNSFKIELAKRTLVCALETTGGMHE